jgi:hypothetical protein
MHALTYRLKPRSADLQICATSADRPRAVPVITLVNLRYTPLTLGLRLQQQLLLFGQ